MATLASSIGPSWAKDLWAAYCDLQIRKIQLPSQLPPLLRKDVQIFAKIASAVSSRKQLTTLSLLSTLGANVHIKYRRVYNGLVELGAISALDEQERNLLTLGRRAQRILDRCTDDWRRAELKALYDHMLRMRAKYIAKGYRRSTIPISHITIAEYLRNAALLFERAAELGATSAAGITQYQLDLQLVSAGRSANSYRYVIHYLNEHTKRFTKLKLPPAFGPGPNTRACVSSKRFNSLVRRFLSPTCARDVSYSLICLICLLYVQHPRRVLQSKMSDFRFHDGHWQYKPASVWLEVPREAEALFCRWIDTLERTRAQDRDGWLFPGANRGHPRSVQALYVWLVEHRLLTTQLFPSAIANLVRLGVTEAAVLRQAYGVPAGTANAYLKVLRPISKDRAIALLEQGRRHAR